MVRPIDSAIPSWYIASPTKMIRAVLFDAVGTLFRSRGTIGEIYASLAAVYDFQSDPHTIDTEFARIIQTRGTPRDKDEWKSLVASVFAQLGPFPQFDAFFEELYAVFQTHKGWLCYPETISVLATLKQSPLGLGIVSNFDQRLEGVLEDLRIRQYFDAVVTPHTSGYAKPDARIFLKAISLLGIKPEDAIFAGDDMAQDVEAAARAGLQSVLIDRRTQIQTRDDRLADLTGVLQLIEKRGHSSHFRS